MNKQRLDRFFPHTRKVPKQHADRPTHCHEFLPDGVLTPSIHNALVGSQCYTAFLMSMIMLIE